MKDLEDRVSRILGDLKVPYSGISTTSGVVSIVLSDTVSFRDVIKAMRSTPKYDTRVQPLLDGAFLNFPQENFPRERCMMNFSLKFVESHGRLMAVTVGVKSATYFPFSGPPQFCMSLQELEQAAEDDQQSAQEEAYLAQ